MDIMDLLEQRAVNAAIAFNFENAIALNKEILKSDKKNLGANLRLAYAYLQLGRWEDAKKSYQKILRLQPNNPVARENLERVKVLQQKKTKKRSTVKPQLDPNLFLEIPGKTMTVTLVNLGQKNILAALMIGQEVFLKAKKRRIEIRTQDSEYIGALPDDLSKRLLFFLKAKSEYKIHIKEGALNRIIVFIREERKGKKVARFVSFPPKNSSAFNRPMEMTEENMDEDSEELAASDIEKLAENLTSEEKEYLPYRNEEEREDSDEE